MGNRGHRKYHHRPNKVERLEDRRVLAAAVVINEIHYNPVDSQSLSEFVELFNASDSAVDISAWSMSDGVDYRVPPDTILPPQGFYIIAEDTAGFDAAFHSGKGPHVAYQISEGTRGLQNFGGAIGMDFVAHDNILVNSLGAFDSRSDGFGRSITVQLWERNDHGTPDVPGDDTGQRVLAELVFSDASPGELEGGTRFQDLETPLALGPGAYTIVASGYGVGERVFNGGTEGAGEVNDAGGLVSYVGDSRWGDEPTAFPRNSDCASAPVRRRLVSIRIAGRRPRSICRRSIRGPTLQQRRKTDASRCGRFHRRHGDLQAGFSLADGRRRRRTVDGADSPVVG